MVQNLLGSRTKLFLSVGVADLLALCVGITLAWSSPMLSKMESTGDDNPLSSPITSNEKSWIGGLLSVGAAIGPFPFGFLQDTIGRKYSLLILSVPFLAAYLLAAFATNVASFYAVRTLAGLGVGGMFTVLPTYLAEVSDSAVRGMLGSSMNNFLCLGLVFSYVFGAYLPIMWYNIIAAIFPAAYFVLFFLFIPDSPYYLMGKSKEQAEGALAFIRGKPTSEIQNELKEIEQSVEDSIANAGSFMDIFKSKGTIKALIISMMLVIFQQLSGINVVLFYAQEIFTASGIEMDAAIPPIIIGTVQFASSFISPVLVDKLGRKTLLMISAVGMVISEVPLGVYFYLQDDDRDVSAISFLPIVTLIVYIITYNCGFGPLPWTVMAELFPRNIKSAASSVTASSCWLASFLITFFFDSIQKGIGIGGSFWIFSGCTVVAFIFTLFYVPETKGRSFQEIQDVLNS